MENIKSMKKIILSLILLCSTFAFSQTQVGQSIIGSARVGNKSINIVSTNSDGSIIATKNRSEAKMRIYRENAGEWVQIGNDIEQPGTSIDLNASGNIIAIGSFGSDENGENLGRVHIYENINDVWVQVGNRIDGQVETERKELSVSLNATGDIVVVGETSISSLRRNTGNNVSVYKNINDTWLQVGEDIPNSQQEFNDGFGSSVSINAAGDVVAIGAPYSDSIGSRDSGSVYIYKNINNVWVQQRGNFSRNTDRSFNRLGGSVSLNSVGDILIVGSSGGNYVRIYKEVNNVWDQIGDDIYGVTVNRFSSKKFVSINAAGDIVAIGASLSDGNGANSGNVRVYKNVDNVWEQIGEDINGAEMEDQSGGSISLNATGDVIVIGAISSSFKSVDSGCGDVRVYRNVNDVWLQIGSDINNEILGGNRLGGDLSINSEGNIMAIGEIEGGPLRQGRVLVYKRNSDLWEQIGDEIVGEGSGDHFGEIVNVNSAGDIVAIGAPLSNGNGTDFGYVRIYKNIDNVWTQIGEDIDGNTIGKSLSINAIGDIVAIGAPLSDRISSSYVRVFRNIDNVWTQIGEDIDGEVEKRDRLGTSVSINAIGDIVAIGGNVNDGISSGYVRVFRNIDDVWTQIGEDIEGEVGGDLLGESVSINASGTMVAVGAPLNNSNNVNNTGQVKVFSLEAVLSTTNQELLSKFSLAPNPAKTIINIQLGVGFEFQNVVLYNQLGQPVLESKKTTINIANLAKGIYYVQINTDNGMATRKLIVE